MPCRVPRNVLIPAIMSAMREGFRRIVLIGADHNWARTLWVTDRNKVVSVQPHFIRMMTRNCAVPKKYSAMSGFTRSTRTMR